MSMTIGVDIGGTKVAAGLVSEAGAISHKTRVPMVSTGDAEQGFDAVEAAVAAIFDDAPEARGAVKGIGICSPGPLDPKTGVVLNPPNLPCWRDFPLAAATERAFGVPAHVDNDANAAGLAEVLWGAAVGYRNVFYATLGTGIGTGIVFDKKIYHGRTGSAAEGGHVTIDYNGPLCGCGKRGCIEALCSGPAIAARARGMLDGTAHSQILDLAGGNVAEVRAEHVGQAWREGDALAKRVLEQTAHLLAIWLGNIVDVLEPDIMVVGGGVAELMSGFFPQILAELPAWSIIPRAREIPLVMARYGADAGIAGAAALCG
ncbi:MAG TPA: ROK family protein [Bryobacteraceae bacterium]|nr:ROK family protein [Bryobacteraceae bacterium]